MSTDAAGPRADAELVKVRTELERLLATPGVSEALGRAIDAAGGVLAGTDPDATQKALDAIDDAVGRMGAETRIFRAADLRSLVLEAVRYGATGEEPTMGGVPPIRLRALPSLDTKVIWTLVNESDVAALTREIAIGQVWVRMDRVGKAEKDLVYSLAQDQRRFLGIPHRAPGHPEGRRSLSAAEQAAADGYDPSMTGPRVYRLLLEHGVHADDGEGYSGTGVAQRNRRRVKAFLGKIAAV